MSRPVPSEDLPPIQRLLQIMEVLRAPGGCPWDAEQTHESLVPHLIEEGYEVAEAVGRGSMEDLKDELGDVLLQPVFHSVIAQERGDFHFDDVVEAICDKLIRRHPHVFGDAEVSGVDGVLEQWQQIKNREKSPEGASAAGADRSYFLSKAKPGLPAMLVAHGLQKKVAGIGFDWPDAVSVLDKIREELAEVEEALERGSAEQVGEEIGDVLFVVVNLARKAGFDAETLLRDTNRKFIRRFQGVEDCLRDQGIPLAGAGLERMEAAWQEVKKHEQKS